jgi:hypothetical protein
MTWAMTLDVPAPPEVYDAVHRHLLATVGPSVDGLLVHLSRATATGFQVTEVWESRAHYERYEQGPVAAAMTALPGGAAVPTDDAPVEFDVRGLVIPTGGIAL